MLERGKHLGVLLQVGHVVADHAQTQEQQGETKDKLAEALAFAVLAEQQRCGQGHQRDGEGRNLDLKA